MSKPKRYSIRGFSAALVEEDNGVLVKWEDYAALQAETVRQLEAAIPPVEAYIVKLEAENERLRNLTNEMNDTINISQAACRDLQAENERLRKAGDAVIEKLAEAYAGEPSDFDHAHVFKAWLAAKGVQS